MSLEWYERVPKSKDREKLLAQMGEGKYLGILRRAALRTFKDDEKKSAALQQSALAKTLNTKPQNLRDMESGIRPARLVVCEEYCKVMGLPITILKKVGRGKFTWDGDTPKEPQKAELKPPKKKSRRELPEPEKRRQQALRAENRVLNGADEEVDLDKVKGITIRNQDECSLILTFKVTPGGNLIIDIHPDGSNASPAQLLKDNFTGVRVAAPPTLEYDQALKQKRVFEINVPTRSKRKD